MSEKQADAGFWGKPMRDFTPADWKQATPLLNMMCQGVYTVKRFCDMMERIYQEVRTGVAAPPKNCDRFEDFDAAAAEYERLVAEGKVEDGTLVEWLFATPKQKGGAE